jgi:hypothetical protein
VLNAKANMIARVYLEVFTQFAYRDQQKAKRRRIIAMTARLAPISPRMPGSGAGLAVRERLLNSTLSTGDTVLGFRNPSAPAKKSIPSFPVGIEFPFVY